MTSDDITCVTVSPLHPTIDGWVQGAVRASRNSTTGPEIPLLVDLCTDLHIRMVKLEGMRPIPAHHRAHNKQLYICICHYHAAI